MKKKLILLFSTIFLLSVISAQVTILPNPIDIAQLIGETKTYSATINNSLTFNISNFKFGNLSNFGFIFPNIIIPENSTKIVNFTLTPTTSFSGTKIEKVEFKFLANIPTSITEYLINISSIGFQPNYLTIRAGDTVTWTNKDTIFHNVFSALFNQNINPNQTFSYTFNNRGIYTYVDTGWEIFQGFHGTIEVINRTSEELVHNPNYDFNWTLNLNFFLNPTNITYELLDDTFEVSASGSTEGLIRIKNIGTERAERINLTSNSNWISFQENNFNLEPNEQNLVTYDISPLIFSTNETNKTYTINLTVLGSNINTQSKQILVFVPYTEIFQDQSSAEFVFALLDKFCKANPNNVFCNPNRNITITGNASDQNVTLNVTSADFFDFLRRLFGLETTLSRQENKISGFENLYNTKLSNIESNASASYEKQLENERIARRNSNVRWIVGTFLVITGCIIYGFWKFKRVRRKTILKEGAYEYRS